MACCAVVACVSALPPGLSGCARDADPLRPNVLFVVLDTVRADVLSAYGNARTTSPHLDALGREGIRFTRAYATDFWTLPTHASLLTGRYPSDHGATSETSRLAASQVTLAERLRDAGYRTGAFVSNPWLSRARGFAQGFDVHLESWRDAPASAGTITHDRAGVAGAIEFMADRDGAGEPFFAFVNLNSAHLPYAPDPLVLLEIAPEPRSPERVSRLRRIKGMWAHLAGVQQLDALDYAILRDLYEAEVRMVDEQVGRLISALREAGQLDRTVVIVTADHGENIGDHGLIDHLLSMYESTVHVPLLIRYPPRIDAGRVDDRLVSQVEIVPTVIDLTGLAAGDSVQLHASLLDPEREPLDFVIAENERPMNGIEVMQRDYPRFDAASIDRRVRMLRTGDHKLVWYDDGETLLYDVARDPAEEHDVAEARADLRDELLALLMGWMQERDTAPDAGPSEGAVSDDPRSIEELRALGYLE